MSEEQKPTVELTIAAADAIKLDLAPGDTLAITIKSDDLDEYLIGHLKKQFTEFFPGVRVLIMGVGSNDEVKYSVISENKENSACGTSNFCADCNCGKKEQYEKQD